MKILVGFVVLVAAAVFGWFLAGRYRAARRDKEAGTPRRSPAPVEPVFPQNRDHRVAGPENSADEVEVSQRVEESPTGNLDASAGWELKDFAEIPVVEEPEPNQKEGPF